MTSIHRYIDTTFILANFKLLTSNRTNFEKNYLKFVANNRSFDILVFNSSKWTVTWIEEPFSIMVLQRRKKLYTDTIEYIKL